MARFSLTAAIFLLIAGLVGSVQAQTRIGVASITKNQVSGTIAGQTRVIGSGAQVFQNEVVTTGTNSSAQLLFRDQSTLTIGADARVVLDQFVYDPQSRSGNIVVNIAEGAFRFVSGNAQSQSYKINTLSATIGVRGTIVIGAVNSTTGEVMIGCVEGSIIVNTPTGAITLSAGQFITISSNGTITGPTAITGDGLSDPIQFDHTGNLLNPNSANQGKRDDFNDALDSRDIDLQFPPSTGGGGSHPPGKLPPMGCEYGCETIQPPQSLRIGK